MHNNRFNRHRPLFASPVPREVKKPKLRWRILKIIGSGIRKTCTVIGAFVLISVVLTFLSFSQIQEVPLEPVPEAAVLYIDFADGFVEASEESPFAGAFGWHTPTVHEIVDAIDLAAKDARVKGIMARMDGGGYSSAQTAEVRTALKRFRESGKFTRLYSPSYGEGGGGLGRFYLASAFEERWMQPLGVVDISGISAEMPFFRDPLDKIGVKPEFFKRKEYKTAYENLTDSKMSEPNREEITRLIDDLKVELTKGITESLSITPQEFEAMVNKGLFTSAEALQLNLITHSGYIDVLHDRIKEEVTGDPESEDEILIDPQVYLADIAREKKEKAMFKGKFSDVSPQIAIVHVRGLILDTRLDGGDGIAAADEIAPALLEAADDPLIEAVVLRVDSPGGSPVASETILRAVDRVREKDKRVIVSMGETAASGGYWVAAHADRIFAQPTTLTGSIGVVGGKFTTEELWKKLGVNWETIEWGENSGLWSVNKPFSAGQAERMNATLDQVYNAFLDRVAKGRGMSFQQADAIAGGRVWTGARAVKIGLVDELGGLHDALDYTAKMLGVEDRFDLDIVSLPRPLTPYEEFMQMMEDSGMVYEGFRFNAALGKIVAPVMDRAAVLKGSSGVSTYEPVSIR